MSRPTQDRSSVALRAQIAAHAARLIAEDHIDDFAQAKRKAARQMGVTEGHALPSNQEIEAALSAHRAIYAPEHAQLLHHLRRKAIELMHFFVSYRPYLAGSVLTGVAGEHSNINLILYHDDPKSIEFFLLDRKIDYTHAESGKGQHYPGFPTITFWYDDTSVALHVRPLSAERDGSNREDRASLAEVEKLLSSMNVAGTSNWHAL